MLAGARTEAASLPAKEVICLSLRPPLGDLLVWPLAGREKDEEACPPRRDRRWVIPFVGWLAARQLVTL